jgi:hypothetical protein
MAEYEGERDKDLILESGYEELEELQGVTDEPIAEQKPETRPIYEEITGDLHKILENKEKEAATSGVKEENTEAVGTTADALGRAAGLEWLTGDDIQSVDDGSFTAIADKGTEKEHSQELRNTIQKYLDENGLADYPLKSDRDLWKEFKDDKIDANTFLRECTVPNEFTTDSIELLKIALQSRALHHDMTNTIKGEFYSTRTMLLEKIAQTTDLAEKKAIVVNMKSLQGLVNVHGAGDTPATHRNFILKNIRYLEAIEKNRQQVIACYEGLGETEAEKLVSIKRFTAKQYEKGFFGGYKDNENAALENFNMLYGKNCGSAITAGLKSMDFPYATAEQKRTVKESTVLAWEMEKMVVERAFGYEDGGLRNMSMTNQLPPDEKTAVKTVLKDIGKGAVISGGISLGLTFGVGILSSFPESAPFAPLLAGGLTVFNVVQHIRGAYKAQYDKLPRDENGKIKDDAHVNIADMQIKKVVGNALIASAPVLLASIPFFGAKVSAVLGAGGTASEVIAAAMPYAQKFLSIGLAAKGFVSTFYKARKLGLKKVKSSVLAAVGAVANFGAAAIGAETGQYAAEVGHDVAVDAFNGGEFRPLETIGNAIKQPIGALAGWFAAKLGLSPAESAAEVTAAPGVQEIQAQSTDGGKAADAGENVGDQSKVANQAAGKTFDATPQQGAAKPEKASADADYDDIENLGQAKIEELRERDMRKEAAAQMAIIMAQEKELGMDKFTEKDFRDFARPVIEKIEKLGVVGLNAFCKYCKMAGERPLLPGPLNWLANTLNVDVASTKSADFLGASSPEFLSFHKLFRESNWEPTDELKIQAWEHLENKHGIEYVDENWDDMEGDAEAVMSQEMARKLIASINPNSPLLNISMDDLTAFRQRERDKEAQERALRDKRNKEYNQLSLQRQQDREKREMAVRRRDEEDRARFKQEQPQVDDVEELPVQEEDGDLSAQQQRDEKDRARFGQARQQAEELSAQQRQAPDDEEYNELSAKRNRDEEDIKRFLQQQQRQQEELGMGMGA